MQDMFIQEDQCIERLCLGSSGNVFIESQVIQEGLDVGLVQVGRVLLVVEKDVLAHPMTIALLGTWAVVATPDGNA